MSEQLYAASRRYSRLDDEKRKELAAEIAEEIAPSVSEAVGLQAFAVTDKGAVLTSVTLYADRETAEKSSRRPPKDERLQPEDATVREVRRPRAGRDRAQEG